MPVALNADRLPATPEGEFFRKQLARWPQGLWVVTPAGETLGFHYHTPTPGDTFKQNVARWVEGTCVMLDEAAKKAGPLPPRAVAATNPFPERGVGVRPDGGVRLALGVTGLRAGRPEGDPVSDSVVVPARDWAAFAPPTGARSWTLPDSAAKRLAPALSPLTDSIFVPRPGDLTESEIAATRAGNVVRYRVRLKSRHLRDGRAGQPVEARLAGEGVGELDPATGRLARLLIVLEGAYVKAPGAKPAATAAVIEWRAR